jgi:hypothetical protein
VLIDSLVCRLMVHIRRERMQISTLRHILSPFAPTLWLTVSLAIVVFIVLLVATSVIQLRHNYGKARVLRHLSFQNSWHHVIGIFCQQGEQLMHFTTQIIATYTFKRPTVGLIEKNTIKLIDTLFYE